MKNGLMSKPPVMLMNVCWRYNMNYVMMFVGLITVAIIPEYAGAVHTVLQSMFGLFVFAIGAINLISTENNA